MDWGLSIAGRQWVTTAVLFLPVEIPGTNNVCVLPAIQGRCVGRFSSML